MKINSIPILRPRQNGRHFPDDTFKYIFVNENVRISVKFSIKFVPQIPINNIPALVRIIAWRRPGDKPLSEPMMVRLPTHICVTRPQWVKVQRCINTSWLTSRERKLLVISLSQEKMIRQLCVGNKRCISLLFKYWPYAQQYDVDLYYAFRYGRLWGEFT